MDQTAAEPPERRGPEPLSIVPPDSGASEAASPGRRRTEPQQRRRSRGADPEAAAAPLPGGPAEEPELPFEAGLAELETIVRALESGEQGLEEALRLYERGVALVRGCGAQLDRAEARLQVLALDAAGKPSLQPGEEMEP
jgi:exodeoxyribonuclease VII small subunit